MQTPLPCPTRGVYAITPDGVGTPWLAHRAELVLAAGVAILQYRNKSATSAERTAQARVLRTLCNHYRTPLIVNDEIALAAEIGADGVHLGEDDAPIEQARLALGAQAIIGISCYDDLARAERAAATGATYLAFGAFFPTRTKQTTRRASPELLKAAKRFGLPRVAIGGIKPDNAPSLISAGADLVAVVSGIFETPDPAAAVRAFRTCFDSAAPKDLPA